MQICADQRQTKSAGQDRPACPPLHRFSRIPNRYFQYAEISRKFVKKFLEQALGLFQKQRSTN
jgi:hypothetical protein